jgi:flagellar M-ring protein FliF
MATELADIANSIGEGKMGSETGSNGLFGLDTKTLALIGVAVLAITVVMFQVFFSPKYTLLYSELSQSDAAAISSYLEKNKIKFKISPEGDSIMVSGASIPKLRLEMANKGLPKGDGVGFEIFDKSNINISDFNQKINYTRALEGELARTISSLESIKSAKVHLVLPKKSIFKDEDEEAKASVIITTHYGEQLNDSQINGIQHLVASAIQGLKPSGVQITDQDGRSLVKSTDAESLLNEKSTNNEKRQKEFEKKLESDLMEMLSPILGKGNVLVNVSTEMNFDEAEVNIELYNPKTEDGKTAKPVIRSEKVIQEKYRNERPKNFGTVGTQTNMPGFITKNETSSSGSSPYDTHRDYIKEDSTKNYEVSKSVERIRRAVGMVKKISVAVVVNKDLDASERSTLRQTVQVAAGLNMDRGDQVIVTGIKFSSTPYQNLNDQEVNKEAQDFDRQAKLKKYLSLALLIAVGIGVGMIVLLSLTTGIDSGKAKEIDELLKEEDIPILHTIDEKIQEAEEAYSRQLSLEGNRSVASMKHGLSQMALQDPKTIARGLQAYIND